MSATGWARHLRTQPLSARRVGPTAGEAWGDAGPGSCRPEGKVARASRPPQPDQTHTAQPRGPGRAVLRRRAMGQSPYLVDARMHTHPSTLTRTRTRTRTLTLTHAHSRTRAREQPLRCRLWATTRSARAAAAASPRHVSVRGWAAVGRCDLRLGRALWTEGLRGTMIPSEECSSA
jgi:hypothetical protein